MQYAQNRSSAHAERDRAAPKINWLILSVASSFSHSAAAEGIPDIFADLDQELTLALYKAAYAYDTEQDKFTFGSFAKKCLNNSAISFLRKARSSKRRQDKAEVTLKKEKAHAVSFLTQESGGAPSIEFAKQVLSETEYTVIEKYIEGMTVSEIAKETGMSAKSVSNAVFRGKRKIKELLQNKNS